MTKTIISRFRPTELTSEIVIAELGIEVFYSEETKKAIFYSGRSQKKDWFFRFNTVERMHEKINETIQTRKNRQQELIERKAKQKELAEQYSADHFFKIGDIVVNSWGYEQTNIEYYQVTKITKRQITVERIAGEMVENSMYSHGMACEVRPVKDAFLLGERNEKYTLTVKPHGEKSMSLTGGESYYHFYKHDGKPEYKSWYA